MYHFQKSPDTAQYVTVLEVVLTTFNRTDTVQYGTFFNQDLVPVTVPIRLNSVQFDTYNLYPFTTLYRVDVSIDTKTLLLQGEGEKHDEEGTKAPRYIPAWVLSQEDLDSLMAAGAGVAPDIIYA